MIFLDLRRKRIGNVGGRTIALSGRRLGNRSRHEDYGVGEGLGFPGGGYWRLFRAYSNGVIPDAMGVVP